MTQPKRRTNDMTPQTNKRTRTMIPAIPRRLPRQDQDQDAYLEEHSAVKSIYNSLLSVSFVHTELQIKTWDKYYGVIKMACGISELDPCALVYECYTQNNNQYIKDHCAKNNGWEIKKGFQLNYNHTPAMKYVEKYYNKVIKDFNADINKQQYIRDLKLANFTAIKGKAFSPIIKFFRDFWLVYPHMAAKDAFEAARTIGEKELNIYHGGKAGETMKNFIQDVYLKKERFRWYIRQLADSVTYFNAKHAENASCGKPLVTSVTKRMIFYESDEEAAVIVGNFLSTSEQIEVTSIYNLDTLLRHAKTYLESDEMKKYRNEFQNQIQQLSPITEGRIMSRLKRSQLCNKDKRQQLKEQEERENQWKSTHCQACKKEFLPGTEPSMCKKCPSDAKFHNACLQPADGPTENLICSSCIDQLGHKACPVCEKFSDLTSFGECNCCHEFCHKSPCTTAGTGSTIFCKKCIDDGAVEVCDFCKLCGANETCSGCKKMIHSACQQINEEAVIVCQKCKFGTCANCQSKGLLVKDGLGSTGYCQECSSKRRELNLGKCHTCNLWGTVSACHGCNRFLIHKECRQQIPNDDLDLCKECSKGICHQCNQGCFETSKSTECSKCHKTVHVSCAIDFQSSWFCHGCNMANNLPCFKCGEWINSRSIMECQGRPQECNKTLHQNCFSLPDDDGVYRCDDCLEWKKSLSPPTRDHPTSSQYREPGSLWKQKNVWKVYMLHHLVAKAIHQKGMAISNDKKADGFLEFTYTSVALAFNFHDPINGTNYQEDVSPSIGTWLDLDEIQTFHYMSKRLYELVRGMEFFREVLNLINEVVASEEEKEDIEKGLLLLHGMETISDPTVF